MNTKQPCPAKRLHGQIARLLNGTQADKDEVTQILITFLAVQIASYDPLIRDDVNDAAVDTLDSMVVELGMELDVSMTVRN